MNKIDVKLIDASSMKNIKLSCLITRGSNKYESTDDLLKNVFENDWSNDKNNTILKLNHSKIARFIDYTFVITGASRRFLAQLSTHHVGISIMSGSLQYSDYSKRTIKNKFFIPYNVLQSNDNKLIDDYLDVQESNFNKYCDLIKAGISNDDAGYIMPQSLRNVLLVKINLEELMNLGKTRLCKRNTDETRFVIGQMIRLVSSIHKLDFELFAPNCVRGKCLENTYSCGEPIQIFNICDYLKTEFGGIT